MGGLQAVEHPRALRGAARSRVRSGPGAVPVRPRSSSDTPGAGRQTAAGLPLSCARKQPAGGSGGTRGCGPRVGLGVSEHLCTVCVCIDHACVCMDSVCVCMHQDCRCLHTAACAYVCAAVLVYVRVGVCMCARVWVHVCVCVPVCALAYVCWDASVLVFLCVGVFGCISTGFSLRAALHQGFAHLGACTPICVSVHGAAGV